MPIRILMIIDYYYPVWGGAQTQLKQLILHLRERGCRFLIATRRWDSKMKKSEDVFGTQVYRLGIPGQHLLSALAYVFSLLIFLFKNRNKFDIIHTQGAALLGALGRILAWLYNKKNVARIATAGRIPALQKTILGKACLNILSRSDGIICLNQEILQELKTAGVSESRIEFITNAVDSQRFQPWPRSEKEFWLKGQGLPENTLLVIFSGRLIFRKGLDLLIEAWKSVVPKHPQARLIIMGTGKPHLDSIEEEIKAKVRNEKIRHILFLGQVENTESILGIADVFVMPSRKEGLSNTLLEAMSAKLRIVASDIGGNRDLIKHHINGLLFESGNTQDLTEKICDCLNNFQQTSKLAEAARANVLQHHQFEEKAEQYYGLYSALMRAAPRNSE